MNSSFWFNCTTGNLVAQAAAIIDISHQKLQPIYEQEISLCCAVMNFSNSQTPCRK